MNDIVLAILELLKYHARWAWPVMHLRALLSCLHKLAKVPDHQMSLSAAIGHAILQLTAAAMHISTLCCLVLLSTWRNTTQMPVLADLKALEYQLPLCWSQGCCWLAGVIHACTVHCHVLSCTL